MIAAANKPLPVPGDLMVARRAMAPCLPDEQALVAADSGKPAPKVKGPKPMRAAATDADRVKMLEDAIACLAEVGGTNGVRYDGLQQYVRDLQRGERS